MFLTQVLTASLLGVLDLINPWWELPGGENVSSEST